MANPTTNYGFVLPTPTDLVTDLPADFDVALQGVDTRLKALQPGTTLGDIAYSSATANTNTRLGIGTNGQVLAVSGGVPAWTTTADVTPLTTKGDLFTFTTVDARLGVGTDGQTLVADSTAATGLKWATPASGVTFSGCSLRQSSGQSISNTTQTDLNYDTEDFDTDGYHSTSSNTNRITIPTGKSGYFLVTARTAFGANTSGTRINWLLKNGSTYLSTVFVGAAVADNTSVVTSAIVSLVATDYITINAYQTSGSTLTTAVDQGKTNFSIQYLGA